MPIKPSCFAWLLAITVLLAATGVKTLFAP